MKSAQHLIRRILLLSVLVVSLNSQTEISFSAELKKQMPQSNCADIKLQVLGSGGPEINDGLASASFLLWVKGKARIMVDAGGGSSLNFEKASARFNDLDAILLTHLHVDHSAALPVYVKAGYFTARSTALAVYGPGAGGEFPSTERFIKGFFSDQAPGVYPYLSDNIRLQPSTDFLLKPLSVKPSGNIWQKKITDKIRISAIDVVHGPVPALAWRIDYGACSVSFSGDMNGSSGHLQKLAKNTDLLVANNAIPQGAGRMAKNLHMTPQKIAEIASEAQVKKLAL
ncbi:hypothetical protein MNBD_GAMMA11-866, partial [hydrothermal vent metagenome]